MHILERKCDFHVCVAPIRNHFLNELTYLYSSFFVNSFLNIIKLIHHIIIFSKKKECDAQLMR